MIENRKTFEDGIRFAISIIENYPEKSKSKVGYRGLGNERHRKEANLQAYASAHERKQVKEKLVQQLNDALNNR